MGKIILVTLIMIAVISSPSHLPPIGDGLIIILSAFIAPIIYPDAGLALILSCAGIITFFVMKKKFPQKSGMRWLILSLAIILGGVLGGFVILSSMAYS